MKRKRAFSISQKIWFSLSILVLGYLFSMVTGQFYGHKTESRILTVSDRLFPAAQISQTIEATFEEQIRLYNDAVLIGEISLVQEAEDHVRNITGLLQQFLALNKYKERHRADIEETIRLYGKFTRAANSVYHRMAKGSEAPELMEQVMDLAHQTKDLRQRFERYAEQFSKDLKNNLTDVHNMSHRQRFIDQFLFVSVVSISLTLIYIIINRSVINPLKKTLMLEMAAQQVGEGIAVTDLDGRIRFVNKTWAKYHGYTHEELIGLDLSSFHAARQNHEVLSELYKRVKSDGSHEWQINQKRKDGTQFPATMTASLLSNEKGRAIGLVIALRDISLHVEKERELKAAKAQAEDASIAKSEFLANMSHEIRTPLNGVMGVLNLLQDTTLGSEQMDLVETGKRSANGLLTVINDILDFSKIEAGKLDIEIINFDMRGTIEEVVELPAMLAHQKQLEFAYEVLPDVPTLLKGDPGRIRQIIINLCNNAIKFTNQGEIYLRIALAQETDDNATLYFEVRDSGIGIAEERLSAIFESFQQSDSSTTREYGGTGLGLTICKKLVNLMGGEIGVKSQLGKGSVFWLTVPFEKQVNCSVPLKLAPQNVRGKRFLVVDDNHTNLEILKNYIEVWGCKCDTASSGKMALSLIQAVAKVDAPFDAVITDMLMPGMDGTELGRRIKADPNYKDAKLIMLTSMGLSGDVARIEKIGFNAYLTKPVNRSQLFNCLVTQFSESSSSVAKEHDSQMVTNCLLSDAVRKGVRVLVAEDNFINLKIALKMLENFGMRADGVANGKEVLSALKSIKYNLVLMDLQMPEMDGLEATRRIREEPSGLNRPDIPIIALTANAMKGDREKCLAAGMDDHVAKPIDPQELSAILESHLTSVQ